METMSMQNLGGQTKSIMVFLKVHGLFFLFAKIFFAIFERGKNWHC